MADDTMGTYHDDLTWGRFLERVLAFLMIIAVFPILLLTSLVIKLFCPTGPVIYRQLRVGLERRSPDRRGQLPAGVVNRRVTAGMGQPFMIWKFRTMIPDAESKTGPVWAAAKDPRVTSLGNFLRKSRIDELPQLFNVLFGEMSLIGPRPERPHFVSRLSEKIPEYQRRLTVPPGITGLAQVNRAYDADENDVKKKVQYDLFYIENHGLRMKLLILAKTIDVVLHRRGSR